jgi:hypothetical protein
MIRDREIDVGMVAPDLSNGAVASLPLTGLTADGNGSLAGGVAFVALSTESPYHSRGNVYLADAARSLRRQGFPSRLFQVQLAGNAGEAENEQRLERLVERLVAERCRWAVFDELWTPDLGRQLQAAGIGIIETRRKTFEDARFVNDADLPAAVRECGTGRPLHEFANLVEIVGPREPRPVSSIDLRVAHACGYKRALSENAFYRDVLGAPEVAAHRGCAYCVSALPSAGGTPDQIAARILDRIRTDRQAFPAVDTIWMAFAETYYDALSIAFRTWRDDPAWHGITLAMQCRPDVIAARSKEIETLAADALACGTQLRIGVVGFENFSPREILVLNRGAAPEQLDAAADILNGWLREPPAGLLVHGFTPSFILFTPWTTLEDIELNLQRIALHGLWSANIERLRIGTGTPVFAKAERDGLVADGPVRAAAHPNGYSSERDISFVDPRVAAVSGGFERLRPYAMSEQAELLSGLIASVRATSEPRSLDWDAVARTWEEVGAAARAC